MATKTIGITEEVYGRLKARKRDGESFTELIDRLLEETGADWRVGFGSLPEAEGEELESLVEASRNGSNVGLVGRQRRATQELEVDDDETA